MSLTSWPFLLAQAQTAQALGSFVPLILVFAIFWFLIIAPARKRQKQLQATVDVGQLELEVLGHVPEREARSLQPNLADPGQVAQPRVAAFR